jgi:coproporphyrinogen III oxidase
MTKLNFSEFKSKFSSFVKDLQNEISDNLKKADPDLKMTEDKWERKDFRGHPGGGGITRAFAGNIIENAGVNTSLIFGAADPKFFHQLNHSAEQKGVKFSQLPSSGLEVKPLVWAAGISLIIHPRNPKVPTVHANFRLIHIGEDPELSGDKIDMTNSAYWMGGGADLTPFYPRLEDFTYFHNIWKKACGNEDLYHEMKNQCDEYFVNYHRENEMRGIGGIFYDYLQKNSLEESLEFSKNLGNHFIESYFPIVEKRKNEPFTNEDEEFQLHRRGRYVEFNLLHDRGTSFGLKSNGRTDSILISLPGRCKFTYRYQPKPGSPHEEMMKYYKPQNY